jgi:hypothetical protein
MPDACEEAKKLVKVRFENDWWPDPSGLGKPKAERPKQDNGMEPRDNPRIEVDSETDVFHIQSVCISSFCFW